YLLVLIEVKSRDGKSGFSQNKLAEFMSELGCTQAFNLDGGNSAIMVIGDRVIKGQPGGDERQLYDIIYFATMQP
ncbi:MAG: phosphodiester glycosidase family protein, partial [Clostridia bacterium]|nr:phosphodiester glycosidase family protein [Clostridia bacterium]